MGRTRIEWATHVWNPTTGCSPVSEGCQNCYARRMATRLRGRFGYPEDDPFKVTLHPERLEEPLWWRKPRRVFVCSMGDLFHQEVSDKFINKVFAVMALASQHTFLVLTKRPTRMLDWFRSVRKYKHHDGSVFHLGADNTIVGYQEWPLPNVWLGVTAENQARANERIPILLQIPAAVRFVSCEPLLGPVDLGNYFPEYDYRPTYDYYRAMYPDAGNKPVLIRPGIQWVVVGGETGPNARPMHPDWVRSLRDQCQEAGIPFFFKQWGEFAPITEKSVAERAYFGNREIVDPITGYYRRGITDIGCRNHVFRVGRKAAGRLLDGWTWDEFPNMEGVIDG